MRRLVVCCAAIILACFLVVEAIPVFSRQVDTHPQETSGAEEGGGMVPPENPVGLFLMPVREGEEIPRETLAALGLEKGDPLGRETLLVRLPLNKVEEAKEKGIFLRPYSAADRLAPGLQGKKGSEQEIEVLVTLFRSSDREGFVRKVPELGGEVLAGLEGEGRVLRLRLPEGALAELAAFPEVVYVEPAQEYRFYNERARDLVGAAFLQAAGFLSPEWMGLSGRGQIIGLADSGIDAGSPGDIHPDLQSLPGQMPKVVMLKSWAGAATAADFNGHGTHMAATVAGTGAASQGRFKGIAPGASIYFQGLLDESGKLTPPPDLTALFEPAYAAGVRVHINGWGGEKGGYFGTASQIDRFLRRCPDFLAVFSAGNGGPEAGKLTPEAYSKNALVVGASRSPHPLFNPAQNDAGSISSFSSRGPTADGRIKPELYAPGSLISARSRLADLPSALSDGYTYLEGTSMAAAVAGGGAALLREFFQRIEKLAAPSAALVKAALICGARTPQGWPNSSGFGILDLGGTVLSLWEKTFRYVDAEEGVAAGETLSYTFEVKSGESPFKATLVWTDPGAAPGAEAPLVNNLDLVVRGPEGSEWIGNSFLSDRPDDVNNVEQVVIPAPKPGIYTVYVKGKAITKGVTHRDGRPAQDFALVYGQPLVRDVVTAAGAQGPVLESGRVLAAAPQQVRFALNGEVASWPVSDNGGSLGKVLPGADVYFPPGYASRGSIYIVGRTFRAVGVQVLDAGGRYLLTEINPEARSGGLYFAPAAEKGVLINGVPAAGPASVPPGGGVTAWINPGSWEIWGAEFSFSAVEGLLGGVDMAKRELTLIGVEKTYSLAPQAALAYSDEMVDVDAADLPFGAAATPCWENLLPGLRVRLVLSPATGEVTYVAARRELAVGMIAEVDVMNRRIVLSTGRDYTVPVGVSLSLDEKDAHLQDLRPGQYAVGVLLPKTRQVLSLSAYSSFLYGQVVYTSLRDGTIYFVDNCGRSGAYRYQEDTGFYRWGLPAVAAAAEAGCWARLILKPGENLIWRLDVAETTAERREIVAGYDEETGTLITSQGRYRLTERTSITKNGYPVAAWDLVPGEEVALTPFLEGASGEPMLAAVAARTSAGTRAPELEVTASWRQGEVVLMGSTTADRLYLYPEKGDRMSIPVDGKGSFHLSFRPEKEGENFLLVVAVDGGSGGVTGWQLTVSPGTGAVFRDVAGHWAERAIEELAARGVLKGYPDGTFRPDDPITRSEFTVLVTAALGLSGGEAELPFADAGSIPSWARPAVERAYLHGLVRGSADGCFRPARKITRAEAAAVLSGALSVINFREDTPVSPPHWRDDGAIPTWARPAVERVYAAGVMTGRPNGFFAPGEILTRAEAVSAVRRLLERTP